MREYANAVQDCLGARAIWEPGAAVYPGDYGQIVDGCFVRLGSTADLGARLRDPEIKHEGRFEFSRGISARVGVSATTAVEWTGEALSSLSWAGGAGVFLGGSDSHLLTIEDLGRVVREALSSKQWAFNWRLVRQVRTLTNGVVVLGGDATSAGKLALTSDIPLHSANVFTEGRHAQGFLLRRLGIAGAVYAHTVRLRPWLAHGAAPLDHELWYDDDFDD
jgi:hypothetical protein